MGKQHAGVEHGQHHIHPQDNGKGREGALHDLIFVADLVHGGAGGHGVIGADKVTQGGTGSTWPTVLLQICPYCFRPSLMPFQRRASYTATFSLKEAPVILK